jgi:predicted GIY-YIG superfamily endonuclease
MQRTLSAYLYILECRNGAYYVGTTRGSLETRVSQHNEGTFGGYTAGLRPVKLVFAEKLDRITDGIAAERQIKNWSRAKKEALIRGDFKNLKQLAKGRS